MDLPKFLSLLTSSQLWLTSAEVLAQDDPHEGTLSNIQFAHRAWDSIGSVPKHILSQIVAHYSKGTDGSPEAAFRMFVMEQEQLGHFTIAWRRNYYVSCWHAANVESVAMWKLYSAPSPGVAVVSNGARIEEALRRDTHELHIGSVKYFDQSKDQIDWSNGFNTIMSKRSNFDYEHEVRLVYCDTADMFDPLAMDKWNDETLRFDDVLSNPAALNPGVGLECDLDVLIESVVISPAAPAWYEPMIVQTCEKMGLKVPIRRSTLFDPPRS